MERDQLFLAAKKGDIVTIETLINAKYIDVNIKTPRGSDWYQVTISIVQCLLIMCIYVYIVLSNYYFVCKIIYVD